MSLMRPADVCVCGSAQVLGALDDEEALTPLGQHLSKMPMDIRLAKTLIYASMLRWPCNATCTSVRDMA